MAALQTSRNAHNLPWLLRFRIGLFFANGTCGKCIDLRISMSRFKKSPDHK